MATIRGTKYHDNGTWQGIWVMREMTNFSVMVETTRSTAAAVTIP